MALIKITKVAASESTLIVGLIKSDDFCRSVIPTLNVNVLKSAGTRVFVTYLVEYFNQYNMAPRNNVQTIFESACTQLSPTDVDMLTSQLEVLENQLSIPDDEFKVEYHVEKALDYINTQNLYLHADEIKGLVACGRVKEAVAKASSFDAAKTVSLDIVSGEKAIDHINREDHEPLLKMAGEIGTLFGAWERSWLIAFMAQPKGGKSFYMMEVVQQALLRGLKVVVFSHELSKVEYFTRILQNAHLSAPIGESSIRRPFFDCLLNRDNVCNAPARQNKELYSCGNNPKYSSCTVCANINNSPFSICITDVTVSVPVVSYDKVQEKYKGWGNQYGKNLYFQKFPQNTATYRDMTDSLDYLADSLHFIPDVIISDHAEAQGPEMPDKGTTHSEFGLITKRWNQLKRMADERKALVITGTQSNRDTVGTGVVEAGKIADNIHKLDMVDGIYGIGATGAEKRRGVSRVYTSIARHVEYDKDMPCTVLQHLKTSKVVLDSRIGYIEVK